MLKLQDPKRNKIDPVPVSSWSRREDKHGNNWRRSCLVLQWGHFTKNSGNTRWSSLNWGVEWWVVVSRKICLLDSLQSSCEVNNMNKDNLHFLLFNNAFTFFFFFALLEWKDLIGLIFFSDKIIPLPIKIAKETHTTWVFTYICFIVILLLCMNCYFDSSKVWGVCIS